MNDETMADIQAKVQQRIDSLDDKDPDSLVYPFTDVNIKNDRLALRARRLDRIANIENQQGKKEIDQLTRLAAHAISLCLKSFADKFEPILRHCGKRGSRRECYFRLLYARDQNMLNHYKEETGKAIDPFRPYLRIFKQRNRFPLSAAESEMFVWLIPLTFLFAVIVISALVGIIGGWKYAAAFLYVTACCWMCYAICFMLRWASLVWLRRSLDHAAVNQLVTLRHQGWNATNVKKIVTDISNKKPSIERINRPEGRVW
jgi:hypothetical protein